MDLIELISAVPIRTIGRLKYVRFADVPEPFRQQLINAIAGSACPIVDGEMCVYEYDWRTWVNGTRYGGYNKPTGFDC